MLFQQNVDAQGNRVYGIFLYVVMTDNELQERTWTRDIRYLQFVIQNSDGRQLKDKTTVAMYRENQLSWGFPGLLDNSILLRDPVVNSRRTIDIVCRMRYHPNQEKLRRPLSPNMPGLLSQSMLGGHAQNSPMRPGEWDPNKPGAGTPPVDSVGKHLKRLLNNHEFSDLEIIVGPERHLIHAHKCILAARSEWFRSALRPGGFLESRENRIKLVEDDPKIFEALLEFLYTGDYPLTSIESSSSINPLRTLSKRPETSSQSSIHFSPRSPPSIPPRTSLLNDDTATSTTSFTANDPPETNPEYDFFSPQPEEPQPDMDYDSSDDAKFALFLMADKYGVTALKTLIRLHLSSELLDTSSNAPPGQRLLRLIRFAFEDLPESTRTSSRNSGRDSGVGSSCMSPTYGSGYTGSGSGFGSINYGIGPTSEVEMREGTASAFSHSDASDSGVGVAMSSVSEQQRRSLSRIREQSRPRDDYGLGGGGGMVYGRDNETGLLREGITVYVAKMFHVVRHVEGFEDLLREGGEMGGFVKGVMENMFRP